MPGVFAPMERVCAVGGGADRRAAAGGLVADGGPDADDQQAIEAIDAFARLWFWLAFTRGYGRRLAWKLLTEADDEPSNAPTSIS